MDNTELVERLKVVLASAFSLYLKAHNYHWNVTGPNFGEYHQFFSDYYTAVHESTDLYAEHIRMLDAYAPVHLKDTLSFLLFQMKFLFQAQNLCS